MAEIYKGLFIRDTLADQGTIPSVTGAPTYSPDIICYQSELLSLRDASISYDRYICKDFLQGNVNNIFVRVKNNADHTIEGSIKAFYSPLNLLYQPGKWKPLFTEIGESVIPVICEKAETGVLAGKVGMGERAFRLDSVEDPNKHHCMMGMVTNEDGSFITLPEDFKNDNGLWEFLRMNPQIAYNNITIVQPKKRVFETPVQYGNYDETPRKFILSIEVTAGLETLNGTEMLIQSTNVRRPFSYRQVISGEEASYSCEYTVGGRVFDYFDFAFVMPDYEKVKAMIHVKNYAVNASEDSMGPDVSLLYDLDNRGTGQITDTATMLGDFYICLGRNMDGVRAKPAAGRVQTALPVVRVTKQC